MRILQLIDTLEPGGAERMAVNYANVLLEAGHNSYLVATRREGVFKKLLKKEIGYFFLDKKGKADLKAFLRLREFILKNKIEVIHAHSTSWFFGVLVKLTTRPVKLIWHDHYGNSEFLNRRKVQPIKLFSRYFDGIISVNQKLKHWAETKLNSSLVIFLRNFIVDGGMEASDLKIDFTSINLVCLANFRPQKDHINLLKACDLLSKRYPIKLHLIGNDFKDAYSKMMKTEIEKRSYVINHGVLLNPMPLLMQMNMGILSSVSEALPVSILEYAMAGIPVVCTNVGECAKVVGKNAKLVPPDNSDALMKAIIANLELPGAAKEDATFLKEKVLLSYSEKAVIPEYFNLLERLYAK